jgi:signal transduction histidine kinase
VRDEPGGLALSVKDDGVGVDTRAGRRTGVGLVGIEERVREVGGALYIRSGAAGTTLEIRIPVPAQDGGMHESVAG